MGQVFGQKGHIRPKGSKYTRWFKIVLKGPILKVYNTYILFITSADGIFINLPMFRKSPFANRKSSSLVLYIPGKVYFCTNEICGSHLAKNYITLVKQSIYPNNQSIQLSNFQWSHEKCDI